MPDRPDPACIRIVQVEDDLSFVTELAAAIATTQDLHLVAAVGTRANALDLLSQPPADVLLVDLGLPDGSGIDVIKAARAQWPSCAIMVCTTFGDEMHVLNSIEAGANGYLLKDSAPKAMVDEIRSLHSGGSPISPLIARQVLVRFRQNDLPQTVQTANGEGLPATKSPALLSAREQQVLELIAKGFTYDEIARLMDISRYTVLTFVRRIYAKLEVKSKTEAIYEARILGILPN